MMSRRLNRDFVRLLHITRMFGKFRPFTPNPGNNHYYLLICPRVHNPGQHQPGHRDEQGPEYFLKEYRKVSFDTIKFSVLLTDTRLLVVI